jgi:hypothetical protein
MLKISQFPPRQCRACAQSLPDSQRVDSRARMCRKEDMFRHNVELSDRQDFPRSSWNLDRKNALQRIKNTLVASIRGTISLQP